MLKTVLLVLGFVEVFLHCGWGYLNLLSRTLVVNYGTESRKIIEYSDRF